MRAWNAFAFDVKFQWRHGFYGAYVLVCAIYGVLLHFIPDGYLQQVVLLLTFSDPSALGLIFAGGIVLLERDQGIHDPLFVTPIRTREYLLGKALSLSMLSLLAAWVIHLSSVGLPASPFSFSAGIILTSSFITLVSIGAVVRCRTVNHFILLSQAYILPFLLPLLGYFGLWESKLFLLLPTEGTLRLLKSAFLRLSFAECIYSICILLIWNYAVYKWALRSYEQHVLLRVGGGGQAIE